MNASSELRRSLWASAASIFTSTTTLLCCALPALLVAIGAGATLAGLVSAVPQLIWLSQHKLQVFGGAGLMLLISGVMQWRARSLPCPADPPLAAACARTRRMSHAIYLASLAIYVVGVLFAFGLPALNR